MKNFAELRAREFSLLDGQGIYLNSASIGPVPNRSLAVLEECNRDRGRPATWNGMERLNGIFSTARRLCAQLIGAETTEIALMPNTTIGLNVAARALSLKSGDVVVSFDGEFPANIYPWLARANEGIKLELLPRTAEGWPDEARMLERINAPEVKAVAVSLTQFANGYTVDLGALSRATRAAGKYLVVDAIQGIGHVPVDVSKTPVDFLACGAQKWLLSPWGTGFLYVRKELIEQTYPTFAGWASFTGTNDYTKLTAYNPEPWPDARRFELITLPLQDFAAMNVSLELLLEIGVPQIRKYLDQLGGVLREKALERGAVVTSPSGVHGSAIVCVKPRGDVAAVYRRLTENGVCCSLREGALRFSPHVFNTEEETRQVTQEL